MVKRLVNVVQSQWSTCVWNFHFHCVFLECNCVSVVGKGRKKVWDVHYWGYMARRVRSEVTTLGIYARSGSIGKGHMYGGNL